MAYTKLFSSIIMSTVWREDDHTRLVWISMLAIADKNGEVQASVPGLADAARVPVEACRGALQKLMSPDPDSRTKDDEGRRIAEIPGGWELLNHGKYRMMASKDEQVEKNAERQRRFKARRRAEVTKSNGLVTPDRDIAEAEAEEDTDKDLFSISPMERKSASAPRTRRQGATDGKFVLPKDWALSPDERGYAGDRGLDPDATADVFSDYFHNRKGRTEKRDGPGWRKRWEIWCRADAQRPPVKATAETRDQQRARENREAIARGLAK